LPKPFDLREVALAVRRLTADRNTEAAELARQTEAARQETRAFTEQLEALATAAADTPHVFVYGSLLSGALTP
jgi:hypothetical protein